MGSRAVQRRAGADIGVHYHAMTTERVYVITLQFDSQTFERLQILRVRYFPPSLNYIPAHLTLLHAVSVDQVDRMIQRWSEFDQINAPPTRFTGVRSLGRGTALIVESPGLNEIRASIMRAMAGAFSRQDRHVFKPHVTIQNKVDPNAARALLDEMSETFVSWEGTGRGVIVWRYLGGPWSLERTLPFKQPQAKI